MAKRKTLQALNIATQAKSGPAGGVAAAETKAPTMTTAIHIPRDIWELLRRVSFRRAQTSGGRASVSKVLTDLVADNRMDLERELD